MNAGVKFIPEGWMQKHADEVHGYMSNWGDQWDVEQYFWNRLFYEEYHPYEYAPMDMGEFNHGIFSGVRNFKSREEARILHFASSRGISEVLAQMEVGGVE